MSCGGNTIEHGRGNVREEHSRGFRRSQDGSEQGVASPESRGSGGQPRCQTQGRGGLLRLTHVQRQGGHFTWGSEGSRAVEMDV